MISKTNLIFFSPTRTTKKVLNAISSGLAPEGTNKYDLTYSHSEPVFIPANELAIIGIPVYAGRVPEEAIKRLNNFKGNNTPAVLVAVYGNRHYDDALLELHDLLRAQSFKTIAAAAFIGEHSYSTPEKPIAENRPDNDDLEKATDFGKQLSVTIANSIENISLVIPGNNPYKEKTSREPIAPQLNEELCTSCGECATLCPTSAISINGSVTTDAAKCILCCACTKGCPSNARHINHPVILGIREKLHTNFSERREPELFLP